jgi:two-component system sensor histidine kinase YesM
MIMNKLNIKNSIFSRLVVIFLLIMIPIYILGIYNYYWGIQTVKQEISKSTVAQQQFYLEGLEKEIENIKTLQYDCLTDENLNKLAIRWDVMDNYSRSESMRLLQQRLVTIKNSSNYIHDVIAYILPIQRSISAITGLNSIDMNKFQSMKVPAGSVGAQIIQYQYGIYLSTMQENMPFTSLFLVEVELNKEALRQALVQFNTYAGSGSFLIDRNNAEIVSDSNNLLRVGDIVTRLKQKNVSSMESINIGGKDYYIVYNRSDYLNIALIRYIPAELILHPLKSFYLWVWLYSCVAIGIIIAYSFSAYKYMHKPLLELVKSFHRVEAGDFQVSINHDSNDEFGYLYKRFNEMIKNLNMLIKQVYEHKILAQRAELKHLQTQINPHFLYNSFFVLNTMALLGDENLIPFTKQLGEYFRFLTRNSSDYIPLIEEINHAKVYLSIQATRFSKRLRTRFMDCPAKFHPVRVPRLILQPILENAFEHGIEKKKDNGLVAVAFEEDGNMLDIIVEDSGSEITDSDIQALQLAICDAGEESEITGILNIHRRIQLTFGGTSGLRVMRSGLGGLKAVLRINTCGSVGNE